VDPRTRLGAEERQMVGGDVDRPTPRPLDARPAEPRQQPPQPGFGASGRRRIGREPPVECAAVSDRPGAAAHQHAPVVRRPEVVEEHPPVDDRLAGGPADLLEQLGFRLGEHDIRAEVREAPPRGTPPGQRRIRRQHDLGRAQHTVRGRHLSVAHTQGRRALVHRDAGRDRSTAQRTHE